MEKRNSNLVYYETPLLDQIDKLQQENQKLNDSINQSNLAKISALLKLEKLQQEKEDLIKKPKVIVQNKLKEITEEYHKLDKKNLNTANIMTHQYNSMRTVLEEVLSELKESDKNESN